MKLTTDQISKVEETLVLNNIQYDDIKLELTDHIASEIEEKISIEGVSFEIAFHKVFENWKEQLRPSSSLWLGKQYLLPKIIMDKWIKNIKKQQKMTLLISFIFAIVFTTIARTINNEVVFDYYRIFFRTILILELVLIMVGKYIIWKSNHKTTFSFFYKTNSFPVIIFLFFMGIGLFPIKIIAPDIASNLVFNFLMFVYVVLPIYYLQLAYQHVQFTKKLKLS